MLLWMSCSLFSLYHSSNKNHNQLPQSDFLCAVISITWHHIQSRCLICHFPYYIHCQTRKKLKWFISSLDYFCMLIGDFFLILKTCALGKLVGIKRENNYKASALMQFYLVGGVAVASSHPNVLNNFWIN